MISSITFPIKLARLIMLFIRTLGHIKMFLKSIELKTVSFHNLKTKDEISWTFSNIVDVSGQFNVKVSSC